MPNARVILVGHNDWTRVATADATVLVVALVAPPRTASVTPLLFGALAARVGRTR
jgi:hypothetical protein